MTVTLPTNARGPILDLTLPSSTPEVRIKVRNNTTGKSLTLRLPAGWGGEDLTLNFYRQTIKGATGVDRSALLDPNDHSLWTSEPAAEGVNDIEIEANRWLEESTSLLAAGTLADDSGVGTVTWSNPSNASTSNNSYATATLPIGATSHYLKATNFGLILPTDAEILGVSGRVERSREGESPGISDARARLVKGGVIEAFDMKSATAWLKSDESETYGGATSLWGEGSLTRADCIASTFGFAIAAVAGGSGVSNVARIDAMSLGVTYKTASTEAASYGATAVLRWEKGYY